MFDTLKRLYENGKLTDTGLDNAVAKNWITEAEKQSIKQEA